ncbi:diguanylate cyclase [Vibrio parahaemolyticus]|uniref:GGDEF domain-containing protein n=1 Tax=Vibrio parahaemolyticus TaxID=670 RepID=UPI0006B267B2|nr:GGDEF domain-containing protein [Vibrio parahaemolyticus]KOY26306.1 diguanylate cyclase [Vibrio parahaemolyticus]MCC3856742.1 GGDEF domain-containing protein [Vibrio parahaemolyticus]HCM2154603.1 GGDEF domain-containing protein [Vibrio parahaemolyticus]
MKLSEAYPIKQKNYSTTSKMLLLVFATSLLLANVILLQQTRVLAQSFTDEQKQATWFLFQLSKELSELVSEARRLDENVLKIEGAELQYELAWSRFDLLINSKDVYTFFSRNHIQQYFLQLFNEFKELEPLLVEAKTGDSQAAAQFYRATQTLYLNLVDFVNQNFRLTSQVYETQKDESQRLMKAQYMLFATFVLSILSLTYFFYRESHFHRKLALSDPLTGLGNRNALFLTLRNNTRNRTAFSLCLLDLNGFKNVNDTYGHQAGDTVLCEIAKRLKDMNIDSFSTYRMGGDEFAVVIESSDVDAEEAKKHIHSVFDTPVLNANNVSSLSTSIGVAHYPSDSDNVDFLISIADKRMYKMKFQR